MLTQQWSKCCRDYADTPQGFVYELAGESVVPGIDANNVESIFEEHSLCSHLDHLVPQHNVFATAERKFDFGAVLASVGGMPQAGVKANLKFTNPFKVWQTALGLVFNWLLAELPSQQVMAWFMAAQL